MSRLPPISLVLCLLWACSADDTRAADADDTRAADDENEELDATEIRRQETIAGEMATDAGRASDAALTPEAGQDASVVRIASSMCVDSDAINIPYGSDSRSVKGRASGINGTIEDECDDMGHLIEAECAQTLACWKGAKCAPRFMNTGVVTTRKVDCLGMCTAGACSLPCPKVGETITLRAGPSADAFVLVGSSLALRCNRISPCASASAPGSRHAVMSVSPEAACSHPYALQASLLGLSDGCSYTGCNIERINP